MEEEIVYPIIKANADGSLHITTNPGFDFKSLKSENVNKNPTLEEKIDNLVEEVEEVEEVGNLNTSIDTLREEWNESVRKGLNATVEKCVKKWYPLVSYLSDLSDPSIPIDLDNPKIRQTMINLSLEEMQIHLQLMWEEINKSKYVYINNGQKTSNNK